MRKWNFCAGPAVISEEVLKEVQSEILEFNESGMSVMEMSHRSDIYSKVAFDAKKDLINLLRKLLGQHLPHHQGFLCTYSKHLLS